MIEYYMTGATPDEVWPLVRDFHYSRRMPSNIQHCFAVRESGGLFGDYGTSIFAACIFSIPPTRWNESVIELSRLVRIPTFQFPLTSLIAFGCRHLRKLGYPLAVSFADWTQTHHGGIYQAAGWNFAGLRDRRMDGLMVNGKFHPGRSCNSIWGTRSPSKLQKLIPHKKIEPHFDDGKFLYWKALTIAGKTRAKRLGLKSLPYPKPNAARPVDELDSIQSESGATPEGRSNSAPPDCAIEGEDAA